MRASGELISGKAKAGCVGPMVLSLKATGIMIKGSEAGRVSRTAKSTQGSSETISSMAKQTSKLTSREYTLVYSKMEKPLLLAKYSTQTLKTPISGS